MTIINEEPEQAEAPEKTFNPVDAGYVANLCAQSEFLLTKIRDLMAEVTRQLRS